jgi:putative hydrolase of the HAD superfamily
MPRPSVTAILSTKRAVIFDLFHTLTSLESTWGDNRPLTSTILGVSQEAWNEQLLERSRERLTGEKQDAFAIVADMARAIKPAISDDVIRCATENRIARFAAALIRIPAGTQQVLATLRKNGHLVGLISNADVMEVAAWSKSPIAGQFDSTIFSCHVGCAKPDAEIYRRSLAELGVTPAEAMFIGDGGSNELEGAKALGISTVMITGIIRELWPDKIPARLPHADFVIDELAELIAPVGESGQPIPQPDSAGTARSIFGLQP